MTENLMLELEDAFVTYLIKTSVLPKTKAITNNLSDEECRIMDAILTLKEKLDFEIRILERWLMMHKRKNREVWYRDAQDHIGKLRQIIGESNCGKGPFELILDLTDSERR
jgi:hypothetical protein